jgi:hypothetical protein
MIGSEKSTEYLALNEIVAHLKQYFDRSDARFERMEITIEKINDSLVVKMDSVEQGLESKIEKLEQYIHEQRSETAQLRTEYTRETTELRTKLSALQAAVTTVAVMFVGAVITAFVVPRLFGPGHANAKPAVEQPEKKQNTRSFLFSN